jgi:hypothetical protein
VTFPPEGVPVLYSATGIPKTVVPDGFNSDVVKVWVPDFQKLAPLHDLWIEEWNRIYGYRQ